MRRRLTDAGLDRYGRRVAVANMCSLQSDVMQDFGRDHEIEHFRRSLAMLPAGADALKREEAMALLGRLRDVTARLRRVEDGLRNLLDDGTADGPTASGGPRNAR